MMKTNSLATSLLLIFCLTPPLCADDWPQWMGPQRDNIWRESGLIESFPEGGPRVLWRQPIAGGYAGPAVAGGRVYVADYVTNDNVKVANFDRKQFSGTERVLCLEEETGKLLWSHEYAVNYNISYPAGPRCTPNVHEGKVYTLGADGHLFCFNAENGDVVWSKHLPKDYNTKTALWGYAGHPLIDGNKLICVVGGEGSHAVAFNKKTGEEMWRTLSSREQGYAPPTIIEAAGVRQLILFRPNAVASVNPENGKLYWTIPYQASNGSAIMTPVHVGNFLYVAGYSNKNMLIELGENEPTAKMLWQDRNGQAISPVNVQPFYDQETLFGFDQNGLLYGVEIETGKRLWQSGAPLNSRRPVGSGTAFFVKNGDRFWMFNEFGELLIAKITPQGFEEIDRAKVIEQTNVAFGRDVVWCPPAWANKHVYIRNDKECICVDLSVEGNTR